MSYLAQHDFLTELPNRLLLNDRLTQAIACAQRHRTSLAVLFLDVDHFKHVNDSLGHAIGDQLLQSICTTPWWLACATRTPSADTAGMNLVLLAEVTRAEDAALTANKILAEVSRPHLIGHQDMHVTVSVGIGVYPDDGADAETLLQNADIALFQAKAHGRSNHQFFEPDMEVRALEPANRSIRSLTGEVKPHGGHSTLSPPCPNVSRLDRVAGLQLTVTEIRWPQLEAAWESRSRAPHRHTASDRAESGRVKRHQPSADPLTPFSSSLTGQRLLRRVPPSGLGGTPDVRYRTDCMHEIPIIVGTGGLLLISMRECTPLRSWRLRHKTL